jgi:hypothetical protein
MMIVHQPDRHGLMQQTVVVASIDERCHAFTGGDLLVVSDCIEHECDSMTRSRIVDTRAEIRDASADLLAHLHHRLMERDFLKHEPEREASVQRAAARLMTEFVTLLTSTQCRSVRRVHLDARAEQLELVMRARDVVRHVRVMTRQQASAFHQRSLISSMTVSVD